MDTRNSLGNQPKAKKNNPPRTPSPPPVVLVPETPYGLDEIPIATEDEATPTPAAPPSPQSYAQAAAMPAARSNVVVWPRNLPTAASTPSPPPPGQWPRKPAAVREDLLQSPAAPGWTDAKLQVRRVAIHTAYGFE